MKNLRRLIVVVCLLCFCQSSSAQVLIARGSGAADTTAPEVSAAAIGTNGTTITVDFTETVVTTGYDDADLNLDCTTAGNDIALNSISGTGSQRTFTAASTINSGDTCNLDYVGSANEIEDAAGNDLGGTVTNIAVTNNSTQGAACASPGSERLVPNSNPATRTNWVANGCTATTHHQCVDDTYGSWDDADTFLNASYDVADDNSFGLSDTASMGADCTTSTIVVTVRGMAEQGPTYDGLITVTLNIGGSTANSSEGGQELPTTWGNLTYTFTGTWTKAQVDAATLRLQDAGDSGSANDWVSGISVLVNYE